MNTSKSRPKKSTERTPQTKKVFYGAIIAIAVLLFAEYVYLRFNYRCRSDEFLYLSRCSAEIYCKSNEFRDFPSAGDCLAWRFSPRAELEYAAIRLFQGLHLW